MEDKNKILEKINDLEGQLKSYENDKLEINHENDFLKKNIIQQAKSGDFDDMLNEIEERKINKKEESLLKKIFKLF